MMVHTHTHTPNRNNLKST